MSMRPILFLAAAFAITLSAGTVAPAANINVGASECQGNFSPGNTLVHAGIGVMTEDGEDTPQSVICAVPRATVNGTSSTGGFYVDGDNLNGASTSCGLFSFDPDGQLAQSASFTTAAAHYDVFLSLDVARLNANGHITLRCMLPAHANGVLRGVTSVQ